MRDLIDPTSAPDDKELLGLLKAEETDAVTYFSSEFAQAQAEAMDRYHARPYGDEVEGRSKIVTHDIEDMVNWIMPSLMRTFEPSDELITCDDDSLEDGAEILTSTAQYLRHVFFNQVGGEDIIHDFLFDGILQKVGVIRTAWEPPRPSPPVVRDGVTVEQLLRYLNDPSYDVLEITPDEESEGPETIEGTAEEMPEEMAPGLMAQPQPPALMGLMAQAPQSQPMQPPAPQLPDDIPFSRTYSVKLQKRPLTGKPVVETIQPERFLISSRARSLDDAAYHGAQFPAFMADVVTDYPEHRHLLDPDGTYMGKSEDTLEFSADTRQLARFPEEPDTGRHNDDSLREQVTLRIEYIRCDYDRDDIVELRRVVRVGDVILENEVAEESEFTLWSPIRVSHRAIGRSIADTLLDIQRIRTVLTRRINDSISQSLTPRTFFNNRAAASNPSFVDQLLDHDVGSAIGVDGNPNEAVLIQTTPDVTASGFQAMEYWDRRSEEASGVNRHAMGIQPQAITDTKGGIENLQSAANQRVEQVARHAGKAFEVALGKLLRIIVRHQHTPQIFKVSGKRVQWDARQVSDDMKVSVHVGMTAESREKRIAFLAGPVLGAQKELLVQMGPANPIAGLKQVRHTLAQIVNVAGYRDAKPFFAEIPPDYQPPPPGPDPKMAEAQGKQQLAQAELQAKTQLQQATFQHDTQMQQAKIQMEGQRSAAELDHKKQVAQMQLEADARNAAQKAEYERQVAEMKAANEMQIAQLRVQAETVLSQARMNAEMELAREKMEREAELARWEAAQNVRVAKFAAGQKGKMARNQPKGVTGSAPGGASLPTSAGDDSLGSVRFGGAVG